MLKIAILDDYAKLALQCVDWSVLDGKAESTLTDISLRGGRGRPLAI